MMSRQVVTAAVLVGLLIASPVAAQRQRNPGGGGGGAARGAQGPGGRPAAGPQDRAVRPSAGQPSQQPRPYATPAPYARQPDARRYDPGHYAVPRGQAYASGGYASPRYGSPGVVGPARIVPRGSPAPGYGYANRGYAGRAVAPAYGVRPGYAVPRSYAVPRGYVAPRPYPPGYYGRGYYGPPRYVAPGWRGSWGYGVTVITPRFVSPYVVGYGVWQPYYYRPSIGLGIYYGADGLYPFGAIPPAYYDPAPGVVYGGLRITDAPRDAQVFAEGNYAGIVDDFDGAFQHLNLEAGQHRIEIHAPGLTPVAFDVVVQPGQTITLRAEIF